MKSKTILSVALVVLAPFPVTWGQDVTAPSPATTVPVEQFGPHAGDRELTLGGSGASSTDADDSLGGVSASFGQYINDTLLASIRQSLNYANPDAGKKVWNGSTRIALDQHFAAHGPFRPFAGVNFGRIYGDNVTDTWAAGLEGGAKFYVQPKTFIFATAEYGWFFEDSEDVEDTFSDGQFIWNVGIGFNF